MKDNSHTQSNTSELPENDYLWDGSGEADPQIVELEDKLRPLQYKPAQVLQLNSHKRRSFRTFAVAASLILLVGVSWILLDIYSQSSMAWSVEVASGIPTINSKAISSNSQLGIGDLLETDNNSKARVSIANIGTVTVGQNSRLRMVASKEKSEHRFDLQQGSIEAFITAPPKLFFVDTPAAEAIDLGCAYKLRVDEFGNGILQVTLGLVMLEWEDRKSIIPYRASCNIYEKIGPGTPYYNKTSQDLITALNQFDNGSIDPQLIRTVLDNAQEDDRMTLLHLLERVSDNERKIVASRMFELGSPANVSLEATVKLDKDAIDAWRNELGLTW